MHDFRRSLSTALYGRFDVQPHVIESALGHVQGGIAGVYNKADYLDLRRIALQRWSDHLVQTATGERPSWVVTLRRS